ncbi:thiamine phosphate synthase (TMP-TENI domain) [Campylobacter blaseri]|uniref:Thiamine-phosphate synthase n=1 Tax=Campylobacter blaseri TaxID=2042961 RepID=A0A2P8R0Q6_9BACT|nr:thiamine phosphate synthase [Campylobacter blaseri]PSM52070.1 thiamine phosphate synthase [Campylobacter blaseri]PSM53855.1 thiamine phosphate synthase [Campylobacter blaseri]QKF85590.1 thiamine phosphate synthase (TMP-TENI domain) [Campylobacter blaseri]
MQKNQLYVLTDDQYTPENKIFFQVKEILDCGIKLIQFRSKNKDYQENTIKSLISLCEDYDAKLLINDDVDLAKKLNAHGVHIGKDDKDITGAKKTLGNNKIIGVSCYGDMRLALNAQKNGANYVAFGAIFPTDTKKDATICDISSIDFSKLTIPTCIIGGINSQNLKDVLKYNADYIAIVSATYKPKSITENLTNLINIIKG